MGISRAEALDSLRSDDLIGLGMESDAVRRRLHPEGVVGYALVCSVNCGRAGATQIRDQAEQRFVVGGNGLALRGTAELALEQVLSAVRQLRAADPDVWINGLNAAEIARLAWLSGTQPGEIFARLSDAGWNSLGPDVADPGAKGEELEQWLAVHRAAHLAGLRTVAGVRFRGEEKAENTIEFMDRTRVLQDETGGFAAFAPESAGGGLQGPTAVECVKMIAISRLLLDNVATIEAGRATGSLKVLETMLRFGADDAGEVLAQSSTAPDLQEEDLRRVIRDTGLVPVARDPGYRLMFVG